MTQVTKIFFSPIEKHQKQVRNDRENKWFTSKFKLHLNVNLTIPIANKIFINQVALKTHGNEHVNTILFFPFSNILD